MYRTAIYLLLLCGIPFVSYAQAQEINFTQTEEHIEIPGTQSMIIPPDEGFTISSDFHGMDQMHRMQRGDESSIIHIAELPTPFEEAISLIRKDPPRGPWLVAKEYIINGDNVSIFKTDKSIGYSNDKRSITTWIMFSGNEKSTYFLVATYDSAKDKTYSSKFEKSLLSLVHREDK